MERLPYLLFAEILGLVEASDQIAQPVDLLERTEAYMARWDVEAAVVAVVLWSSIASTAVQSLT